ncbi:MAG: hypothetical protein H6581_11480 [Bacteroidia bacterium]|nr:hypothetical protein [Bacteroidia bacterium]
MMKHNHLIIAVIVLLVGTFYSCKNFQGAAVTAKPDPIEVHADSVKYSIRATVPPKNKFKKGGTYTGEAMIGSRSQKKVVITSEKYPKIKKTGVDTTVNVSRGYTDDMNGNPLMLKQSYDRKGKEFELPNVENLAQCCITTSRLVCEDPKFIFVDCLENKYEKEKPLSLEARFSFPKDVFKIQEGDYKKSDIVAIGDFLTKKYPATKITIKGFASPEGPYKRNVMLSVNRSKQVQEWLTGKLKESGYESYLDSNFFDISVTHEDWEGFKASVNGLPYTQDIKSQILEIISAGLSEDDKEAQIMALVGGKEKVENILAPLRRATIKIEGYEPRKTDQEIDKISQDFIDGKFSGSLKETFEKEEWLYAICRVTSLDGKKVLLEAFREAYPSDHRVFNDLGAVYLSQGDTKAGLEMLEKADKLKTGHYAISNNFGVAKMMDKQYRDAKSLFETSLAGKSTPEANFNLGVVLEKMARYNLAVEKFNSASGMDCGNYNAGLCKLLNNDLAGAKASLTEAIKENKEHALSYYVMAVAGARASDASTMTVNLKKACQLDGTLSTKAKSDLEFRKYWSSAEFKAATN